MRIPLLRWLCLFFLANLAFPTSRTMALDRARAVEPSSRSIASRTVDPGRASDLPLFFRSTAGTTWVRVHQPGTSPCPPLSVNDAESGQTADDVWCFEGPGGDSTWPAIPPAQAGGGLHDSWSHWSKFDPPGPNPSKWHVTDRHGGPSTGGFNAWAGCDSVTTAPGCDDVAFWVFQDGYGDDWNHALELACGGQNLASGATLVFDLRYDAECLYDYLYLEYFEHATGQWKLVRDAVGDAAIFNGVSGVPDVNHGGDGRECGDDYFGASDQVAGSPQYGSSVWLTGVSFPLVAQGGDLRLRWRAASDSYWSDMDGRGDTDGLGAVDNVTVTFAADGAVVTDDFETGDFTGVSATIGSASWAPSGAIGNTYDGWHLAFDPQYSSPAGATCRFSDDWLWAARPDGPLPANGFDFFLVSPTIDVDGWTGGFVQAYEQACYVEGRGDYPRWQIRWYDSSLGWSTWNTLYQPFWYECSVVWNMIHPFDEFLGPDVDSIQVAWELVDLSEPGTASWNKHGGVNFLVDNVAFGRVDASETDFFVRSIDLFADTFSRSDPAHTPFLANAEQGQWVGIGLPGYSRAFADVDSLTVEVHDTDGVTAGNVALWWRHDDGGAAWSAWSSVVMDFAVPDVFSATDEGQYRAILGKDDGGAEDLTAAGDGLIWKAGTTVEYYVAVTDDAANDAYLPTGADVGGPPFEFSVLPFDRTGPAQGDAKILVVDAYGRRALDVEGSEGFDPTGGLGTGMFDDPAFASSEKLARDALDALGLVYDRYDVRGAGSSVNTPPRGLADASRGLGGLLDAPTVPHYDAIVWLSGDLTYYTLPDTSRLALAAHLDGGGHLLVAGDGIAAHLGVGGNDADSTIGFLGTYLGTAFPTIDDDATESRTLSAAGAVGTAFEGVSLGVYGDCPERRSFDRLTLAAPAAGSANSVVLEYANGGASDDGRPAAIENVRTASGGAAVLAGFDPSAYVGLSSRACFFGGVLASGFGLTIPNPASCLSSGVDAPAIDPASTFGLARPEPSPFRATTALRFGLPVAGLARLTIYDVAGRVVRRLVDEPRDAGPHVVAWDGRNSDGGAVPAGIYFARLEAADLERTRKVVRLR